MHVDFYIDSEVLLFSYLDYSGDIMAQLLQYWFINNMLAFLYQRYVAILDKVGNCFQIVRSIKCNVYIYVYYKNKKDLI